MSKLHQSFSSYSNYNEGINMNYGMFGMYQLLGDSQFVRLCVDVLKLRKSFNERKSAQVGFCVSGQTLEQLVNLVQENFTDLPDKVIIMIGTNDVKNTTNPEKFEESLYILKEILKLKKIIWLTIPPIPKFERNRQRLYLLHNFNEKIKMLEDYNIKVIDTYPAFVDENNVPYPNLFEHFYQNSLGLSPRIDGIHLNKQGLVRLAVLLCYALYPKQVDVLLNYRRNDPVLATVYLSSAFDYVKPMFQKKYYRKDMKKIMFYFLGKFDLDSLSKTI